MCSVCFIISLPSSRSSSAFLPFNAVHLAMRRQMGIIVTAGDTR